MELKQRIDILIQGAELAQKGGVLSLDDAVVVKNAIDSIKGETDIEKNIEILSNVINFAQRRGVYTLQDSYYLYIALDGITKELSTDSGNTEHPNVDKKEKSEK